MNVPLECPAKEGTIILSNHKNDGFKDKQSIATKDIRKKISNALFT
jgi:hypothetical protein